MEVDDIQTQVSKFQRICCNNNNNNDKDSNKIVANKVSTYEAGRLYGWPSSSSSSASRIVRVSRASGGKDRHSKVLTSKGLRDRRVRLSVTTAIQFYDLQDRLGYDQPSKAVEWLINAAASSIAELPSLDPSFVDFNNVGSCSLRDEIKKVRDDEDNNDVLMLSKSGSSSASETSKCSGLSLSRSENRIRARERARGLAASKKEKEKEITVNGVSQTTSNSNSFTDLLTGGGIIRNTAVASSTPMDYFQQFGNNNNNNCSQSQQQQRFSFLQENLSNYATSSSAGYNNNRGTLQSNLMSNLPHHNHHLQRFHQPMVDGSTSTNFPFFVAPNMGGSGGSNNQFLATGLDSQQLRLYGGDGGEGHYYDHHKDKSKS